MKTGCQNKYRRPAKKEMSHFVYSILILIFCFFSAQAQIADELNPKIREKRFIFPFFLFEKLVGTAAMTTRPRLLLPANDKKTAMTSEEKNTFKDQQEEKKLLQLTLHAIKGLPIKFTDQQEKIDFLQSHLNAIPVGIRKNDRR